ncbi:AP2-like ethylene-responsive transcription factor AIL1 isoform A [Chlorella sorokiniana]|uniref:AP2-like ethylene-responsive transcription factor AIL1 isoform A n=1 Tax=Chlorella sorokiniana TaxID=3076 RepID=A0A2P6TY96_CHLSO|nr:AP2-like ethylene-responsive transcription factor AIL1 isoform B [Chlorella sorokiniana]PRW59042.1 AP2-like ethylene-responsive transcription factor AIL1 isoform A [Chlorella sorokiniana]|eukprot:PRW59041.1 AP2-like ethylene-responsive transcription factor AIL1 isoform B [Chlorella sorokiniana]
MAAAGSVVGGFTAALQQCMEQAASQAAPAQRTGSGYRGVTLHKRTQRYEGHVWIDKKQVYLGAFDDPKQAACGHDIMALRSKGQSTRGEDINFPLSMYEPLEPMLSQMTQADVVAALRSYSKSLTRVRRPASAPPASGRAGRSPSPFSSRAASPVPAADASPFPSRASSPMPGGGRGGAGGRGGNKRKALTPTASVTDLESLERSLLQQQAAQQAAAAMSAGGTAVARGGGGSRPRRPPPRPVAGSWGGRVSAGPSSEQAMGAEWGMRPASTGTLPGLRLPPLPPGAGSAAAVLPPSRLAEPYSPLKIRPLEMSGSVLDCGPLVSAPGLPLASPPPPPLIWPQPCRATMFSPPMQAVQQEWQPPPPQQQDMQRSAAAVGTVGKQQAVQGRQLKVMSPEQQQQQQQVGQQMHPPAPTAQQRPSLHHRSPSPLLSPGVASRATRELASIESALRSLADDLDEHAI